MSKLNISSVQQIKAAAPIKVTPPSIEPSIKLKNMTSRTNFKVLFMVLWFKLYFLIALRLLLKALPQPC